MFEISLGRTRVKVIAQGDLAAEALIKHRTSYARSPIFNDAVRMVAGDSVLTLEGRAWRDRRRSLQPAFRTQAMATMIERVNSALDTVIESLEPGRLNLAEFCERAAMSVGLKALFGHSLTEESFIELAELSPIVIGRIGVGWLTSKVPHWLQLPGERRFRRSMARIDEIVLDMVAKRRATGEPGDDVLGTLLQMYADGDLDERGVRDEVVTMLLAGYETTANTLSWTLHEIAKHPEVIAKIRAEADRALGGGDADIRELSYSLMAFKEGLRMFPAALWIVRQAKENTSIGGHVVARGETIACSTYLIHRNPRDWATPQRFDPDRFLASVGGRCFVPFGIGPHICIGKHLALLEGQLTLAKLFRQWNLSPVTDHVPQMRISTTLANADGIYAELRPR